MTTPATETPSIDLATAPIDPAALARLPAAVARKFRAIPLRFTGPTLEIAVEDPLDVFLADSLAVLCAAPVALVAAHPDAMDAALASRFGPSSAATPALAPAPALPPTSDTALIRLVESIIAEAVRRGASDIHFEPLAQRFRIRYRIDGALVEVESPPQHLQLPVISRLKIMGQMSIAEKRLPQDGRIRVELGGRPIDLRAASLPTVHGESVVLRLLEASASISEFADLGLSDAHREQLANMLAAPDGMVLVTGPTGCGKSTTLYSCLQRLNETERKVITVEDPIEIQLRGVTQVAVKPEVGMTFATALRAMLRQAPNAIMVGEIRDRETSEIALNASLTGHLVLSTLHTNDAVGAITRLLDLGAKPFLVAAGLRAVVAQRLVRRVCDACSAGGHHPAHSAHAQPRRAAGCDQCHGTGFRGRVGIFEMFLMSDALRTLVCQRAGAARLRAAARLEGMTSLREDGVRKVLAGVTTIDEVLSATLGDADQPQPSLIP